MYRYFVIMLVLFAQDVSADIYSYTDDEGTITFTDTPLRRTATLVMKDSSSSTKRQIRRLQTFNTKSSLNSDGFTDNLNLPVSGRITSATGFRIDPFNGERKLHHGIDIAVPEGTPIRAVAPGVVTYSGSRGGYGNLVIVSHDNGMMTLYAHTMCNLVPTGTSVGTETIIALSGSTGRSTGPHVHFEAWRDGLNLTGSFLPASHKSLAGNLPAVLTRKPDPVRKITMADGTILLTNIPLVHP